MVCVCLFLPLFFFIFQASHPDSVVVDWTNKVLFVLEFKRTSDQRRDYRERGESRAMAQHAILIRSPEKVAGDAEGENGGWKIKLIIFVGGTSGSVNVQTFNDNLEELHVTHTPLYEFTNSYVRARRVNMMP